ncbi:hypothetical protein THRCLA_20332, partial [Thraustotheca clavata]
MAPPGEAAVGGENEIKERRDPKITLMRVEMTTAMKDEAVNHLAESLVTNVIEKDLATDMK